MCRDFRGFCFGFDEAGQAIGKIDGDVFIA
jgi:hypothetical protein